VLFADSVCSTAVKSSNPISDGMYYTIVQVTVYEEIINMDRHVY
jgi:hypothetical protein